MQKYADDRLHKIPSGCGVTGIMDTSGTVFPGNDIVTSICNMMERGNGLGSGYAAYGIYPEYKDYYCFHIMFGREAAIEEAEAFLKKHFDIKHAEPIPTKFVKTLKTPPVLKRFFLKPKEDMLLIDEESGATRHEIEEEFTAEKVFELNRTVKDAFIFSSGKNMGAFKGVGNPDEIAEFFRIPEYKAYIWTAHNRFPTNSVAWWGGAHPFGLLNWTVVHNGEISSYGINRRYLENSGYYCTLFTDTEVIAYLFDLLVRKHRLSYEMACKALAAPFWSQIAMMDEKEKEFHTKIRMVYGSALLNGPFAIIVSDGKMMLGLNDRTKLRPLVCGQKGTKLFIASEEAAIRIVSRDLDKVWMPDAGKPVIGRLERSS
ncbi:MAG: glutamine amidotransferase family protein [Candidatus Firestonebacteria bacterium]